VRYGGAIARALAFMLALRMKPEINAQLVRRVAHLARLSLSDVEIEHFTQQFQDILGYVDKLSAVDTSDIAPMTHAMPMQNVLRADEPHESFAPDTALKNAPARHENYIKVPPVLDQGGGA
jgi:aspartyl-tRNA(Asn)/glutamyl-tRNA(Gln) amidotransferase subunit C